MPWQRETARWEWLGKVVASHCERAVRGPTLKVFWWGRCRSADSHTKTLQWKGGRMFQEGPKLSVVSVTCDGWEVDYIERWLRPGPAGHIGHCEFCFYSKEVGSHGRFWQEWHHLSKDYFSNRERTREGSQLSRPCNVLWKGTIKNIF